MRYFLIFIFFISCTAYSQDSTFTFRGVKWGMSKKDVLKSEKTKPFQNDGNTIMYSGIQIDRMKFGIVYEFDADRLNVITLIYDEKHYEEGIYYEKFKEIQNTLDSKYGDHLDHTVWRNELYKDDQTRWGFAASAGHVAFRNTWDVKGKVIITLQLEGDNFACSLGIGYHDPNLITNDEPTGF